MQPSSLSAGPPLVLRASRPGPGLARRGQISPLLRRLQDALSERGWLESCTPGTAHSAAILRGRWAGRRLRLAQWPGDSTLTIRLALRGGPEVTVRRANLLQRLDPRTSPTSARIGSLWVQGHPAGVGRLSRRPSQLLLRCLFSELGLEQVQLGKRWARVRRECEQNLGQASYFSERLLDLLGGLANLCDAPLIARRPTIRAAQVLRCPFCHDSLRLAAEQAAGCKACGTLHHTACALEAGRCTTLGCTSLGFQAHSAGAPPLFASSSDFLPPDYQG